MQRCRGGLVFEAHRLCVALNSRLESNTEREDGLDLAGKRDSIQGLVLTLQMSGSGLRVRVYGVYLQG